MVAFKSFQAREVGRYRETVPSGNTTSWMGAGVHEKAGVGGGGEMKPEEEFSLLSPY